MSNDLPLEELKAIILDKEHSIGTDELLGLIAEYFDDEELSSAINNHIDALDRIWRRQIEIESKVINAKLLMESATGLVDDIRKMYVPVKEDYQDESEL